MLTALHFFRANRGVKRILSGLEAIHQGVWLGLLSRDELQRVTAKHYVEQPLYKQSEYNVSGFFHGKKRPSINTLASVDQSWSGRLGEVERSLRCDAQASRWRLSNAVRS